MQNRCAVKDTFIGILFKKLMVSPQLLTLGGLGILLLLGLFGDRISDGNNNFPRLLSLMAFGFLLGQTIQFIHFEPLNEIVGHLQTPSLVGFLAEFTLALVLFREGLELNFKAFLENLRPILVLAFGGVIIATFLFAFILQLLFGFSLLLALLISGMLVPTDPAATFSMFKGKLRLKSKPKEVIGGESALNDAVAIALVTEYILVAFLQGETVPTLSVQLLQALAISFFGGILLGYILAIIFLKLNTKMKEDNHTNFLSLALVIMAFVIPVSMHTIHLPVSSAITALTSGIVFGNPTSFRFQRFSLHPLEEFHVTISELGELVAFVALGTLIRLEFPVHLVTLGFSLAIIGLIVRIGTVMLLSPLGKLKPKESLFIGWGGMKGLATGVLATISFNAVEANQTISSSLPFPPHEFLSSVLFALFLSTILQGIPLKLVAKRTDTIILSDRQKELELKRSIITLQISFLQQQKEEGKITEAEYHIQSIPLRDKLAQVLHDLEVESRETWKKINSYLVQFEMITFVKSSLGVKTTEIENERDFEDLLDREEELAHVLSMEIDTLELRLETAKETQQMDGKKEEVMLLRIFEHLSEIKRKYGGGRVDDLLNKLMKFEDIIAQTELEVEGFQN